MTSSVPNKDIHWCGTSGVDYEDVLLAGSDTFEPDEVVQSS